MAHNTREFPDNGFYYGRTGGWETFLRNIDEKTKKALTATGGTWAPSAAIFIGGAGIGLQGRALFSAASVIAPGVGFNFIFGDDDYFKWPAGSPYQRTVDTNCLPHSTYAREFLSAGNPNNFARARRNGARISFPVRLHDGAKCTRIDLFFKINDTHVTPGEGVPAELPQMRLVKNSIDGIVTPFGVNAALTVADPNGWVRLPRPANAAAYFAAGATQTLTMHMDGSATGHTVDRSKYSYTLEYVEENGNGARLTANGLGATLHKIRAYLDVPDLRPQ